MDGKRLGWKDILYLGLGIVLIAGLVVRAEPARVLSAISGIDLTLLGTVVALYVLNLFAKVLRWSLIVQGMGERRPGWIAAPIFLASLALNNSTPGKIGGEPVRALLLKEHTGARLSLGIASIFAEKALDILTILFFAVIGLVYLVNEIGLNDVRAFVIGIAVGSVFIILGLLMVANDRFSSWSLRYLRRLIGRSGTAAQGRLDKVLVKIEGSLARFHGSIGMLMRSKKVLLAVVLLDLEIWLNEAARLYLVVLALPTSVEVAPLGALAAISIANILGFILPIGSGNLLGSTSVLEILTGNERISASASIVAVATSLWLSIPLGLISLSVLGRLHHGKGRDRGRTAGPGKA